MLEHVSGDVEFVTDHRNVARSWKLLLENPGASRPQKDLRERARKSWRARPGQLVAHWTPSHTDE
eukprot:6925045-Pyramimonas_sp.AAC.1